METIHFNDLLGETQRMLFNEVKSASHRTFGAHVSSLRDYALLVLERHGFGKSDTLRDADVDVFLVTAALASSEFVRKRPELPVEVELASDLLFALCALAYADSDVAPDDHTRLARLMTAALRVGQAELHLHMARPGGPYSYVDESEARHMLASSHGTVGANIKREQSERLYRPMMRDFVKARDANPAISLRGWVAKHVSKYPDEDGSTRSPETARKALKGLLEAEQKFGQKPACDPQG